MNCDKTTDIIILKTLLSKVMVRLKTDIATSTKILYYKDDWVFVNYTPTHVEIWFDNPAITIDLTFDEAEEYLERIDM